MADIDLFQRRVSHVARGCPTAVLRDAIVQAAEDFCERTWIWRGEAVTQDTVEGQDVYVIEPDLEEGVGAAVLSVYDVQLDGGSASVTTPTRDTVRFWQAPQAGVELTAKVVLKPARDSQNLPDFLHAEWQDAIAAGARYKLLDMAGSEWFQPQLSDKYRLEFERLWVPRARVEVAHRQGRPLSVRKRRFI